MAPEQLHRTTPTAGGNGLNFGVEPNALANQWMGNQYYLVIENPIEQTDSVNFGFRIDNMFGNDWQFNYMQGLFNRAFPPEHFAGYDLSQLYGEVAPADPDARAASTSRAGSGTRWPATSRCRRSPARCCRSRTCSTTASRSATSASSPRCT